MSLLTEALAPTNTLLGNPSALAKAVETRGRSLLTGAAPHGPRRPPQRRHAGDGRHPPVHRRRQPRRHPGPGRAPQRGVRAHPVRAGRQDDLRATARRHPAADQQVLHLRHRPRPQPHRAPGRRRGALLRGQLAQPHRRAARLEPRHLRRRVQGGDRGRVRDHRQRRRQRGRHVRGRHHDGVPARPPRRDRRGARQLGDVPGRRARHRPGVTDRDARVEARGRGGPRPLAARRLPRRQRPGEGVRLAPPQRPGVELLGQQLPAGPEPARVRHPLLERRHHPPAGGAARRLPRPVRLERARRGHPHGARHAGRSRQGRARRLRRRRFDRPHRAVADRVPDHAAARRRVGVRAQLERPHPGHRQPARQPEVVLPHPRRRRRRPTPRHGSTVPRRTPGSWWEHWTAWLGARSGDRRPAPRELGSAAHPPLDPAPGRYVHLT